MIFRFFSRDSPFRFYPTFGKTAPVMPIQGDNSDSSKDCV